MEYKAGASKRMRNDGGFQYRKKLKAKVVRRAGMAPALLRSRAGEVKSVDAPTGGFNTFAFSTTATFTLLNGLVIGAAINNRIGRKISMRSLRIRGGIYVSATTVNSLYEFGRLILIYDRQANGAAPVIGDLLQDEDAAGTTTTTAFSGLNMSNAARFKVIKTWQFKAEQSAGAAITNSEPSQVTTDAQTCYNIDTFINLKDLETGFNAGNAGTVADIATGSLYMVTIGLNTAANAWLNFRGVVRLRYRDN